MSLADQLAGAIVARPPQTPPGEDVRRGEGGPARPQRQGPHHDARAGADAPNRGGEALRRADREVRRRARVRCCGASTTPQSGRCFPSYERIAEKADCSRATVYTAINALERAGILTWVNRIARIREWGPDLFGRAQNRWRVIRTSNAYMLRRSATARATAGFF